MIEEDKRQIHPLQPGEYVCDVCVYIYVCACYLCHHPHRTAPSHHRRLSGTSQETLRILGISCVTQDEMSSSKWKLRVASARLSGQVFDFESEETDTCEGLSDAKKTARWVKKYEMGLCNSGNLLELSFVATLAR